MNNVILSSETKLQVNQDRRYIYGLTMPRRLFGSEVIRLQHNLKSVRQRYDLLLDNSPSSSRLPWPVVRLLASREVGWKRELTQTVTNEIMRKVVEYTPSLSAVRPIKFDSISIDPSKGGHTKVSLQPNQESLDKLEDERIRTLAVLASWGLPVPPRSYLPEVPALTIPYTNRLVGEAEFETLLLVTQCTAPLEAALVAHSIAFVPDKIINLNA